MSINKLYPSAPLGLITNVEERSTNETSSTNSSNNSIVILGEMITYF